MRKICPYATNGFTLIELSIVLVIIGLIVGGVLVGRDLIAAAAVRAQVSQIEKYNTAVNTFRGKYSYLPGDIPDPYATQFGFAARGAYAGEGDGNFVLEGITTDAASSNYGPIQGGENTMFWVDLARARLIADGMATASPTSTLILTPDTDRALYWPAAKLSATTFVWTYSFLGVNLYEIGGTFSTVTMTNGAVVAMPLLTPKQAYAIDSKMDDGMPMAGNVLVMGNSYTLTPPFYASWVAGNVSHGTASFAPYPGGVSAGAGTCWNNGGSTANPTVYTLTDTDNDCVLSFKFQ